MVRPVSIRFILYRFYSSHDRCLPCRIIHGIELHKINGNKILASRERKYIERMKWILCHSMWCLCCVVYQLRQLSLFPCVRVFIFKHDDYVWWEYVCACDWITLIRRIVVRALAHTNTRNLMTTVTCYKIIWARNCMANQMRFSEWPREALSALVWGQFEWVQKHNSRSQKMKMYAHVLQSLSFCVCLWHATNWSPMWKVLRFKVMRYNCVCMSVSFK